MQHKHSISRLYLNLAGQFERMEWYSNGTIYIFLVISLELCTKFKHKNPFTVIYRGICEVSAFDLKLKNPFTGIYEVPAFGPIF